MESGEWRVERGEREGGREEKREGGGGGREKKGKEEGGGGGGTRIDKFLVQYNFFKLIVMTVCGICKKRFFSKKELHKMFPGDLF